MSALTDAFEVRYSTQRVLEWTRPEDPNATTKDTTRLAAAGTDAESRFKKICGIAFDGTDSDHLEAAIPGVRAYLLLYLDQGAGQKAIDDWVENFLKPMAQVSGRDRLAPATSSLLVPTVEGARGTVRPNFDGPAFSGIELDNPSDGYSPFDDEGT